MNGANICDDSTCCQAWISKEDRMAKWNTEEAIQNWQKIENSVKQTKGKIIVYNGKPINAFFHSNSGGLTEGAEAVWGRNKLSIFANCSNKWRRYIYSISIRTYSY